MLVTRIVSYYHCVGNSMPMKICEADTTWWWCCCAGKVITTFRSNKAALKNIKNHCNLFIRVFGRIIYTKWRSMSRKWQIQRFSVNIMWTCETVTDSRLQAHDSRPKLTKHLLNMCSDADVRKHFTLGIHIKWQAKYYNQRFHSKCFDKEHTRTPTRAPIQRCSPASKTITERNRFD